MNNAWSDKYVTERLAQSQGRDDRESPSKLDLDARLRGKIGSYAANKIIKAIDDLKSRR